MSEETIKDIADNADIIVAGFAFTLVKNGKIRILNLGKTDEVCILDADGNMLETTMNDSTLTLVQAYYLRNRDFLEVVNA